ncbi:MAG: phosphatidylglycerophosphatase A [Rhodospirillaceae bacterium]
MPGTSTLDAPETPSPADRGGSPAPPLWANLIATWFGAGLSPKAPGTVGSVAALPVAWVIVYGAGWQALAVAAVLATLIGVWATRKMLETASDKDPSYLVIDEVAGQWIALLPAGFDPLLWLAAFAGFRLFDIWKPWPVGLADRKLGGAWGVMLDDLLAGGYACLIVLGLRHCNGA